MSTIAKVIEIIEVPHGDAPEEVRRGWVGCVLPCDPECGHIPVYSTSVLPKRFSGPLTVKEFLALPEPEKIAGFSVSQDLALQVLEIHSPESAAWFYEQGFPQEDKAFRFKREEVKVLKTISFEEAAKRGPIHFYDDLETGTMRLVR